MYYLYVLTGLGIVISFIVSRDKTYMAIRIAVKKFTYILPVFITMFILVSVVLFFLPEPP